MRSMEAAPSKVGSVGAPRVCGVVLAKPANTVFRYVDIFDLYGW